MTLLRTCACLLWTTTVASFVQAQDGVLGVLPGPTRSAAQAPTVWSFVPQEEVEPAPAHVIEWLPAGGIEFALSDKSFWLAFQATTREGRDFYRVGVLGNNDDDFMLEGRIMRFGEPKREVPLDLGVGLAFYGGRADERDANVLSIALSAAARYDIDAAYPVGLGLSAAFAPDVTTFSDGDRLFDLLARVEVDLSTAASAFVGYRLLEVGFENLPDRRFDDRVHAGIRIGL